MIEFGELAKKLGIAKRTIRRLVYMKGSKLRYVHKEDGRKMFDENEVVSLIRQGVMEYERPKKIHKKRKDNELN